MKRQAFIFRWFRFTLCTLLAFIATIVTVAWLKPVTESIVNHELVLADEGNRYNVFARWNHNYYHLRKYPKGVYVVPQRFVVYILMVLNDERIDSLAIEYRRITTVTVSPRYVPLFLGAYVQRFVIPPDPQTTGQDGWTLVVPVWMAVTILMAYPAIAMIRGPIARWRRRRRGVCVICSYNLSGLTEPRCPECGTTF